ncbi:MAG: hypothetical protein HYZ65_04430 [Burkholderiales bacterium]|nr:hypothetical protein [Burkholderiales bacterium]
MRILFWLGLLVLVILAVRKKNRAVTADRSEPASAAAEAPAVESMVCCAHCLMHLPASEAVYRGQQAYCSNAHADLH